MTFALSGSIITQSGTDTGLSGLSAIAGVTTLTEGNTKVYSVGTLQINVTGTLTITPRVEKLISNCRQGVLAKNGGTLNLGVDTTLNGYTLQAPSVAYINTSTPTNFWDPSWGWGAGLTAESGGTINWRGAIVEMPTQGFGFLSGSIINIKNGVFYGPAPGAGTGAYTARAIVSGFRSASTTIDGFRMLGGELSISAAFTTPAKGMLTEQASLPILLGGMTDFYISDIDYGGRGNVVDFPVNSQDAGGGNPSYVIHARATNSASGTNMKMVGGIVESDGRNKGIIRVRKEAKFYAENTSKSPIQDVRFFCRDKNNGVRKNLNSVNDTADKTYLISSGADGYTSATIFDTGIVNVAAGGTRGTPNTGPYTVDLRGNTNTLGVDDFSIYAKAYGYIGAVKTVYLRGLGTLTEQFILVNDTSISLSNTDALTKLSDCLTVTSASNALAIKANCALDNIYDGMKAWATQAVLGNLEYPNKSDYPVTGGGSEIATAMAVTINSGVSLSAGSKFRTINTSGGLTNNGNSLGNIGVIGNVSQATPTNMTGVAITGNLTYNVATDTTITLTNCTISGTVSNTGAGTVTINLAGNSSIGTAGTRVIVQNAKTKTFTGLPSGTEVRIRQGSYTLAHAQDVTTGTYEFAYEPTDRPAKAQFTKPGYVFEDIDLVLNSTDQSLPVTSGPDPSYI